MAATLASFASILKEFYLGPIQDQLNEETLVCEMFEKASVDWNGRQVIIPCHVGRNVNVGWRGEGAPLPGPAIGVVGGLPAGAPGAGGSQQGYVNLTLTAQNLYGRFQISGPAMAAAGKGGANSFVGWVDGEMNRLVNDVKNNCNRTAVSGGDVIGFVTSFGPLGAAATGDALFDGDRAKLTALIADNIVNGVHLVRMDTYAVMDAAACRVGASVPGDLSITTPTGFTFPVDAAGGSIPLALTVNANGQAGAAYALLGTAAEPVGIYGNLGANGAGAAVGQGGVWFGVDRTTATGTANALQCSDGAAVPVSNALSTVVAATGRQAITLIQLQTLMDRIQLASDDAPDILLVNPLQRTRLAAMLQANVQFQTRVDGGKPGTGDGGFSDFAFAGIPVKASRHVDNGLILALSTKHWKMCELEAGKFADEDGNVLSRIGVVDAYEGFYKWYYNTVCTRPNANGLIAGLTL